MNQLVSVVRSDASDVTVDKFFVSFGCARLALPADGLRRLLGCFEEVLGGEDCGPECEHPRVDVGRSLGSPTITVLRDDDQSCFFVSLTGPRNRWTTGVVLDEETVAELVCTLREVLR